MDRNPIVRDFFLGFVRLHILYHAAQEPIFGLEMIHELERHGYNLSPGTLYPILHHLEQEGYLAAQAQTVNGKVRKYYHATVAGHKALRAASIKVKELIREIGIGEDLA